MSDGSDIHFNADRDRAKRIARLWTAAQPTVRSFLHALLREPGAVDDLLQEVAVTIVDKFDELRSADKFASWAMGIARNKVMNYRTVRSRDRHLFDSQAVDRLIDVHASMAGESEPRRAALERCLETLSKRGRAAIDLRYEEELASEAIGAKLGLTRNAVNVLLHRTRAALLECIESRLSMRKGGEA
ncbi:MAG: sigma-70 family RNA polymerase sigma factor [Planctomycetes bacterium]|nr:sigma-70 family RNA polymerase sigma factor [Planctomycetota bacterium]